MVMRCPKKNLTDGSVAPWMLTQQDARQELVVALVREMLNSSTHTAQFHHFEVDFTSVYITLFLDSVCIALLHFIITLNYEELFKIYTYTYICYICLLVCLDYRDKKV